MESDTRIVRYDYPWARAKKIGLGFLFTIAVIFLYFWTLKSFTLTMISVFFLATGFIALYIILMVWVWNRAFTPMTHSEVQVSEQTPMPDTGFSQPPLDSPEKITIQEVEGSSPDKVFTVVQKSHAKKHAFVASSKTKTYHLATCRIGKLIDKDHKEVSNSLVKFKHKHYAACKICKPNQR